MFVVNYVTLLLLYALIPARKSDSVRRQLFLTETIDSSKLENLRRILEFIRGSPDFRSRTLSVVSSNAQGDIPTYLSKFIAQNSMDVFQLTSDDLNDKSFDGKWRKLVDLTWIFLIEDLYTLRSFVEYQGNFWKPNNQYVIVFYDEKADVSWRTVFRKLWRRYSVCRVIVTLLRDDFRWFMKYMPVDLLRGEFGRVQKAYVTEESGDSPPNVSDGLSTGGDDSLFLTKRSPLFETFKDMNEYPINITVFDSLTMKVTQNGTDEKYSGLDAEMMKTFKSRFNCEFRVTTLPKTQNADPFEQSLKLIEEGEIEMIVTSFFLKHYDFPGQAFTNGIYQDKLCFIAPQARSIPKAYMPVVPFPRNLWTILVIYNFIITVLWILIKRWSRSLRQQRSQVVPPSTSVHLLRSGMTLIPHYEWPSFENQLTDAIIARQNQDMAIAWWTMNPEKVEPREINVKLLGLFNLIVLSCYPLRGGDTTTQRTFLVGTLFFSIIIGGLYHSRLVSSFNKPYTYRQIDTIQDVINSNYSLITKYSNLRNVFANGKSSLIDRQIFDKLEVISSNFSSSLMVAYDNVINLGRVLSYQFENYSHLHDEEGRFLLHVVSECPATYMLSYVVKKHSPYLKRLDSIILRLQQSGILSLWYNNMKQTSLKAKRQVKLSRGDKRRKLTLEHYSLTFLGLFIGLACSFLIFMGELCYSDNLTKWHENQQKLLTYMTNRRQRLLSIKDRFF